MKSDLRRMACPVMIMLLGCGVSAQESSAKTANLRRETAMRPVEIRPLPPEMTQRFDRLHQALQPCAQSWVAQQAKVESQRPAPDLPALEAQIRSRFASSISPKPGVTIEAGGSGADVEAMAFVVLKQAADASAQDLEAIMAEVKAMNNTKQQLRKLQERAAKEAATVTPNTARQPCLTAFCKSLLNQLRQIEAATAQSKRPVHLTAPDNLTLGQLQQLTSQLNQQMQSLNDLSDEQQLQIQMLMDRRSQLEQTLSNLLKKQQDTATSIVSNMK